VAGDILGNCGLAGLGGGKICSSSDPLEPSKENLTLIMMNNKYED
jgi:hypothetical protein